jgi:hypothetical protein
MDSIDLLHVVGLPASGGGAGTYLDWGVVHISVANLLVIALMVVTFVAALLLPFPGGDEDWVPAPTEGADENGADR